MFADHVVQYDRTGCAGEAGTSVVGVVLSAQHGIIRYAARKRGGKNMGSHHSREIAGSAQRKGRSPLSCIHG